LPQGELYYYFTITDIASSVDSSVVLVYIDSIAPGLIVHSPIQGAIYNEKRVGLDIQVIDDSDTEVGYIDHADTRPRYRRLCSSCDSYNRTRSFSDGPHNISIRATDKASNSAEENISFLVDSKEPRIKKTEPKRREYTDGVFTVTYDEENPESVTLYYKEQGSLDYAAIAKNDCPSGRNQECTITVPGLAQGELWYYFMVQDIAGSIDQSKETLVYVDTEVPGLVVNSPLDGQSYSNKKISLDIQVTDSNDVEIGYIDYSDTRPRYKRLCSRCDSYNRTKSFGEGWHNVTITATDKAGNSDEENITFFVDSKKPRIKRVEPRSRSYTNGTFTVKYDEENLQLLTLMYKENGSEDYVAFATDTCPSGKNQECIMTVQGLEQGELWYYFVLEDLAFMDESREVKVFVDTVAPVITLLSPSSGSFETYYPFNITISEYAKLEFIDHTASSPRYRSLCSRCDSYDRRKYFSDGDHSLTIRASDKAGNYDEVDITFTIT
jgi:hypothetical protein